MTNINVKFKKILKNIEENVKDKEDLEYVKVQIFELYNVLLEEITRIEELADDKISNLEEVELQLEERLGRLEHELKEVQKDIYALDEDSEFAIICPYCNNEFVLDGYELKDEVACPECSNIIELDWGEDEDDGCDECGGGCHGCYHDEDDM
ncbi:MAG: hypothetical protein FWC53_02345 [Firmicutes bacterium]|nr:hypothetical protein [Bacillota bacterium]